MNAPAKIRNAEIIDPDPGSFHSMSTDQLKNELAKHLQITVESFTRIAHVVRELEERGEDLESLRLSLLSYFRKIAHGQLSAKAVVRFAQRADLLSRVSKLPLPDQEFLADGGPIELVVRQGESLTTRQLDPLDLRPAQIVQVFDRSGAIRNESQQVAYVEALKPDRTIVMATGALRADKEKNGIVLGRKFYPSKDILDALGELSTDFEESGESTVVNLDSALVRLLKIQAAKRDTNIKSLVTNAVIACGLAKE